MPKTPFTSLRNAFLTGLLLLAPLVVTVWAFFQIIDLVGGRFRPLFDTLIPQRLQGLPLVWEIAITLIVFALITLFGFISHHFFGKYLLELGERVILGIPGLSTVYGSVKQVVSTFGSQNRNLFSRVVLVQYPRTGTWTLGFLTNKTQAEAQGRSGRELWAVFVPTSPNPTSGFVLFFPPGEITELDMSVGDGMKLVISGGAVVPPWPAGDKPAKRSN
ncbi:MAG: hypothetical protein JWQ83_698 [Lacunisphaera sp.]|jgi:uncharacterized membrane protein|nr:hypothetical protein [Lacunisphaera sp.]MDB6165558.1 hypothetical protein [Lacunisphaera sp.]